MDRQTLHTLIDAAIDAMDCERCRDQLMDRVAIYTTNTVGEASAVNLAADVNRGTLTVLQAYDRLAGVVRPVYELAGYEISDEEMTLVRRALERATTRGLN
ncbi:hypothetical protein [Streptomyces sp. KR55]|uniref:hypothetical protein n=1 Tax=Streptomyces sp. KR55 TaxID=3457425 RepID=UPI003FD020FF